MVSIAVVGDSPIPDIPSRDLLRFSRSMGLAAKYVPISRVSVKVHGKETTLVIRDREFRVDGAFLRSLGLLIDVEQLLRRITVIRLMESMGTLTINSLEGLLRTRNKLETVVSLSQAGLPTPLTVGTEDLLYAYNLMKRLGDVVVKPIQGSRGYGAFRVNDADVAFNVLKTMVVYRKPIYFQEYIEKPGRDIRVMVIGGEVFGCMLRVAPNGQWKTNIAQGAVGRPCEPNAEVYELAISAVESLGLVYGGVDIGEGRGGYVIFEVNGSPDWRELTNVTGKNPAERLVRLMVERLKR